ncbi:hypothetical protein HHI36_005546 [Cryptolaemus montrouzieri]|uniref:Methylenetetrahydrofolate reductase (NAD(P)H) n=1 Tax=Cryptolaemus montrouzieri TaxID=559131 RepID=A0ABD2NUQ3_9CUCU
MLRDIAVRKEKLCSIEVSSKRKFNMDVLKNIQFSFVSVIWIGKYTKDPPIIEPLSMARELIQRGYPVLLHLPSRCFTIVEASKCLNYAKKIGVKNLLIVRGGGPEAVDEPSCYDFPYPADFISHIKKKFGDSFEFAVAGYPMLHPESTTMEDEMKCIKAKCEAGAKYIVTQSVFSYPIIKEYVEQLRIHNIKAKVIPGIYILSSFADYEILQRLCKIPNDDEVAAFINEHRNNDEAISKYARDSAKTLILSILDNKEILPPHVFTMNEFDIIKSFLQFLYK